MFKALVIFLIAIVLGITTITDGYTLQLSGGVEKLSKMSSQVTDGDSPISGAEVSIPSYDFDTTTSSSGRFEIPKNFVPPYILTVKKAGYDPFSLTIIPVSQIYTGSDIRSACTFPAVSRASISGKQACCGGQGNDTDQDCGPR